MIWGEEYHALIAVRYAEDEHLTLEARDPLRRKVDHGDDLPSYESFRLIVRRELGAGLPGPDLRSEVHDEFYRRLPGFGERLGLDDRADPDVHLLEVFPADLRQSILLCSVRMKLVLVSRTVHRYAIMLGCANREKEISPTDC